MPKMKVPGNPAITAIPARTARRDEIMRGAGAVMRKRRGGALRMEQVADQLGLVKGNIYYYFKDRQDLIFHCHVRCIQMSLEAVAEVSKMDGSAGRRLRYLLERHIEIIIGSDYGGALLADMDEMKPGQRRRYIAMRDQFEAAVRKLIHEGVSKGEFRSTNIALGGFAILGAINWMPKWYRPEGAMKPTEVAEWFANFLLQALKA